MFPSRVKVAAALVLAATVWPGNARAVRELGELLGPNLEPGKSFYSEVGTRTKQTMTVMGMKITQDQAQTFYFRWTPEHYDARSRTWVIRQRIEGIKMEIDVGGNRTSYDSTKPGAAAGPLKDFYKALVGAEVTVTIGPDLTVAKVEGAVELVRKLAKANPAMMPLLQQVLSESAVKYMAESALPRVPASATRARRPWTDESELDMGALGKYQRSSTYTFEGKAGAIDRIRVDGKLKYEAPAPRAGGALPFVIKHADVKSSKAGGTLLFNRQKRRVENAETAVDLAGKMAIEIGDMTTEIELDQTQKTTVTVTDTNPLKK